MGELRIMNREHHDRPVLVHIEHKHGIHGSFFGRTRIGNSPSSSMERVRFAMLWMTVTCCNMERKRPTESGSFDPRAELPKCRNGFTLQ